MTKSMRSQKTGDSKYRDNKYIVRSRTEAGNIGLLISSLSSLSFHPLWLLHRIGEIARRASSAHIEAVIKRAARGSITERK